MRELPLVMPKMSMTMEEGQVLAWHKKEGDTIAAGDIVCEVMTDKVNMDVEATVDGTITRIVVQQGDSIAVGEPMAFVASESDDLFEGLTLGPQPVQPSAPETALAAQPPSRSREIAQPPSRSREIAQPPSRSREIAQPPSRKGPIAAAPLARRRAAQLGIDLATIVGTGVGGAVTKKDVEQAAQAIAAAPTQPTDIPSSTVQPRATQAAPPTIDATPAFAGALASQRRAVRQAVARKMTESAAVPQFTAYADLDVQALAAARGRIGWTSHLVYAVARILREHPMLNSLWQDDESVACDHVGIALAVDTPIGLIAPVIVDADLLTIDEADAAVRRTIEQARGGRLNGDTLAGATFTLSNLGGFGIRAFQALVTPPQVAALSVGAIGEHPVGANGALTVRTVCSVGLTVDHRAADGADAGRFIADLSSLLASPTALLQQRRARSS
jgi:pyruvate dehydrogenase E2 component (dihydrolipoamide acetyltransferase)